MLLAVAAIKQPPCRSCIQVKNAPSIRCETPPSICPSEAAKHFSISSIHRHIGESFSTIFSALRRFSSVSPMYLLYSFVKSSRYSGRFSSLAITFTARLLPQPCTPIISTPFGGGSEDLPLIKLLFRSESHLFKFSKSAILPLLSER